EPGQRRGARRRAPTSAAAGRLRSHSRQRGAAGDDRRDASGQCWAGWHRVGAMSWKDASVMPEREVSSLDRFLMRHAPAALDGMRSRILGIIGTVYCLVGGVALAVG